MASSACSKAPSTALSVAWSTSITEPVGGTTIFASAVPIPTKKTTVIMKRVMVDGAWLLKIE
jgi:hypothetical protein